MKSSSPSQARSLGRGGNVESPCGTGEGELVVIARRLDAELWISLWTRKASALVSASRCGQSFRVGCGEVTVD
jgi:hypothetical protein